LLNFLDDYNKPIKFSLKKIELKIIINFWELLKKETKIWIDYFWESLNIASRILDKAEKNNIYVTEPIYQKIKNNINNIKYIWDFSFKWVIYKIPLYIIGNWNSNLEVNLHDEYTNIIIDVDNLIFKISSVAFLLTVQPIPILDRYFMVLLHLYLLEEIALKYWIKLSKNQIKEIIWVIFLSIGSIYSSSQFISWIWKIGLPIIWWYILAPMNFSITYALWKVFSNYFYYKQKKQKFTNEDIKVVFLWTKDKWMAIAKKNKQNILNTWKKYKDIIVKKIKKFDDLYLEIKDLIKTKN
jgi:uncharacterized protein (DUF697 family)